MSLLNLRERVFLASLLGFGIAEAALRRMGRSGLLADMLLAARNGSWSGYSKAKARRHQSPVEIRHDDDDDFDEVIVRQPDLVHVEVMSPTAIWMGVTLPDGRDVHCNFYLVGHGSDLQGVHDLIRTALESFACAMVENGVPDHEAWNDLVVGEVSVSDWINSYVREELGVSDHDPLVQIRYRVEVIPVSRCDEGAFRRGEE